MQNCPNLIRVDRHHPDEASIRKAATLLSRNGVVIFPAQCLYGIAANARNARAVEKVFALKRRPADNPVLVLVRDRAMLQSLVQQISPEAEVLMDTFWPGNLTLIFKAQDHVSPSLTAGTGKIGIRIPGHPVARALVQAIDFPITGTSANLSGEPGCTLPQDLPPAVAGAADLILDAGRVRGGTGSTVLDLTSTPVRLLREGAVPAQAVQTALKNADFRYKSV